MKETLKLKSFLTEEEKKWFEGNGIDIGCGDDPYSDTCKTFDINDGDANKIDEYVHETFDWVYSSHCLEHMFDPFDAIKRWWKLVKPGGYMITVVPDEDLYEQGNFGRCNRDHKHSFTISKRHSWSKVSVNVLDLIKAIPDVEVIKVELQDMGIDRKFLSFKNPNQIDFTMYNAVAQIMFVLKKKG